MKTNKKPVRVYDGKGRFKTFRSKKEPKLYPKKMRGAKIGDIITDIEAQLDELEDRIREIENVRMVE